MSSEGITKQEDIRNALESRNTVPSYLDLSESHRNDDMYALKKNVLRVRWLPTMNSGEQLIGQVQWNNIQPPNLQTGISKMYINCDLEMTITVADATTAANVSKITSVFTKDKIFMQDINAALYNTQINITGQSLTGQPYIDLPIKRLYDPDFYDPSLINKNKDKNVCWSISTNGGVITVKYHCATPLIHPFFSSENDLAGVNAFTINTNYNISQLFNIHSPAFSAATASSAATVSTNITKLNWTISYNQINYEKPLNDYITLLMWEAYFTEKNQTSEDANHTQLFINNVRDIPSTPICQYAVIVRKIEDDILNKTFAAGSSTFTGGAIPMTTLNSIDITVNSNSNAYNTAEFTDIVHCCRQAGYLGTVDELTADTKKYSPVYAFSSLQYRNIVGSANTYRFNVSACKYDALTNTGANYLVYYVMMQPALFMSNTQGSAFVNNLGVPFSAMIKSESDVDAYIKLLEQSGYSGGSLREWLANLRDKLKRGRYISNAGKAIGRIMDAPIVKNLASMIPVVGPGLVTAWDPIKGVVNKATEAAESLGYGVKGEGVSMF